MDEYTFKYKDIVKIKSSGLNGIVRGFSVPNNMFDTEIKYLIGRHDRPEARYTEDELEFIERQLTLF